MERLLENKVGIVTGAARGIGAMISKYFVQCGAIVYANDIDVSRMSEWIESLDPMLQDRVRPVQFDITVPDEVRIELMKIRQDEGKIDFLVNNAGVEFNELIGMISRSNMEKMFQVNVYGTIEMLQTVSRIMGRQEKGGSIVNISSMVGLRGNKGQLVYSATKGAVIALTKSAAKELASKKIRVNSIAPGLTKTDMMDAADLEKLQDRINNICMGRIAEPRDIAKACAFFVSDLSEYVSGQILPVDGCTIM